MDLFNRKKLLGIKLWKELEIKSCEFFFFSNHKSQLFN